MMELMEEAVEHGITFGDTTPKIHCKAFEDYAGAIEIAKLPKMRPCTRHLNQALHFFRQHVKCYANGDQGKVEIIHVNTKEQIADLLTKPLVEEPFQYLRNKLMGW